MSYPMSYMMGYPTYPPPMMTPFKPYPGMTSMPPMNMPPELYIGDLEEQITEEVLMNYFLKFGQIYSIKIMRDAKTHKSRGFGFISFYDPKEAEKARLAANHTQILNNRIRVSWRKKKEELRQIRNETNLFFPSVPKELGIEDLDSFFGSFGSVLSSKIKEDKQRIGFLQFEKYQSFENLTEKKGLKPNGQNYYSVGVPKNGVEIQLEFTKCRQSQSMNNLYVKEMPKCPEGTETKAHEQFLEKTLTDHFSNFGQRKILKPLVKADHEGRYFGFICFESKDDAEAAKNELNEKDIFENGQKLYVNFAEKKGLRVRKLREHFASLPNETNLFTKNLLKTVTKEDLLKAFSIYGEITSCDVQPSTISTIDTAFGYINFSSKEEARSALEQARNNEAIVKMYNGPMFLDFHQRKDQYKRRKELRARMMPPAMYPYMMPMPMESYGGPMAPHFMGKMGYPPAPGGFAAGPGMMRGPNMMYNNRGPKRGGYQGPGGRVAGKGGYGGPKPAGGYQKPSPAQYDSAPPKRQAPSAPEQPPSVAGPESKLTASSLKERLNDFLALDENKQREILGNLLFPLIKNHTNNDLAPKVTGMLIDFSVFEVGDILEFLENEETLKERIKEAVELITSTGN